MDNQVSNNEKSWSCSKCETMNQSSEEFCKNCGQKSEAGATVLEQPKKSKAKKIIIGIVAVLFLAGVATAAAYYYYTYDLKKQAKAYLSEQSSVFATSISSINDLSTEEVVGVEDKEENFDLYLKKIEEERNKSEKVLDEIRDARQKNEQASSNKKTSSIHSLLGEYYRRIEEDVDRYHQFYVYDFETSKESHDMTDALERMDGIFKSPATTEDGIKKLREGQKLIEDSRTRMQEIAPPSGMEEHKEKVMRMYDDLIDFYKEMGDALEQKNSLRLYDLITGGYSSILDKYEEAEKLYEYHFEEINKKFEESRKEAEKVKTELMRAGIELDAEISDIGIEAW